MKTCILHIGMHKTGTSSLQEVLRGYDDGETVYCRFDVPNHSVPMATLFKDRPETFWVHKRHGRSRDAVETIRSNLQRQLNDTVALPRRRMIISAEALCRQFAPDEIQRIVEYLRKSFNRVIAVAYLRGFEDYLSSAYQEFLKSGAKHLRVHPPEYKKNFAPWVEHLGRENVVFIPYQGDTVADFFSRFELIQTAQRNVVTNTSLSAPAMALLFRHNLMGKDLFGTPQKVRNYNEIVTYLQGISGPKFSFSPEMVAQARSVEAGSNTWMEEVAGFSLMEVQPEETNPIGDERAFQALAERSLSLVDRNDPVGARLLSVIGGTASPDPLPLATSKRGRQRSMPLFGSRPNITLLNQYLIRFTVPHNAQELVISFEAADQTIDRKDPLRLGFGEKFLLDSGYAVLAVLTKTVTWYRDAEIWRFLGHNRLRSQLETFTRIHGYGSSMGGYAACAFSDLLKLDNIVALQPISTLLPSRVPWENRFTAGQRLDWTGEYSDAAETLGNCPSIYAFYDPDDLDSRHAMRLEVTARDRLRHVRVPESRHAVPRFLHAAGALKAATLMALNGDAPDKIEHHIQDLAATPPRSNTPR